MTVESAKNRDLDATPGLDGSLLEAQWQVTAPSPFASTASPSCGEVLSHE